MTKRPLKPFRVDFCEWTTYAIVVPARSANDAIVIAKTMRDATGTTAFWDLDGSEDDWFAHPVDPCIDLLPQLKGLRTFASGIPALAKRGTPTARLITRLDNLIRQIRQIGKTSVYTPIVEAVSSPALREGDDTNNQERTRP